MQQSPDYRLAGVCVYGLLTSSREAGRMTIPGTETWYAYIRVN